MTISGRWIMRMMMVMLEQSAILQFLNQVQYLFLEARVTYVTHDSFSQFVRFFPVIVC